MSTSGLIDSHLPLWLESTSKCSCPIAAGSRPRIPVEIWRSLLPGLHCEPEVGEDGGERRRERREQHGLVGKTCMTRKHQEYS